MSRLNKVGRRSSFIKSRFKSIAEAAVVSAVGKSWKMFMSALIETSDTPLQIYHNYGDQTLIKKELDEFRVWFGRFAVRWDRIGTYM